MKEKYSISANASGRPVQPVILMVDCSVSSAAYRKYVNEALRALILRLQNESDLYNKDVYISLVLFNHTYEIIWDFEYIKDIPVSSNEDDFTPIKSCFGSTDIGNAVKSAIEMGQNQCRFLKEERLMDFMPRYFLFSDMVNNPGVDGSPESMRSYPSRYRKIQELFDIIAASVKKLEENQMFPFVICQLDEREDDGYTLHIGTANSKALTTPESIFHINGNFSTKEIYNRIIHFFTQTVYRSICSYEDIADILMDEQKFFQ